MTSKAPVAPPAEGAVGGLSVLNWVPLSAGLVVLAVPTIITLSQQTWQLESGAHGPIVIVTALWLLFNDGLKPGLAKASDAGWSQAAPVLLGSLALYIFGRAYDFISIEFTGLYGVFIAALLRLFGWKSLRLHLVPLFYLALAVPPPGWLMAAVTAPLQVLVSGAAEIITGLLGYPVARQGVVLFVGPYQLLVEDACSGLNSLFGLTAISVLYVYLMHRSSLRYSLLLLALVVPIALLTNGLRVIALILITYHFGDSVAQGFLHATTGMLLFVLGLLIVFLVDMAIIRLFPGAARL